MTYSYRGTQGQARIRTVGVESLALTIVNDAMDEDKESEVQGNQVAPYHPIDIDEEEPRQTIRMAALTFPLTLQYPVEVRHGRPRTQTPPQEYLALEAPRQVQAPLPAEREPEVQPPPIYHEVDDEEVVDPLQQPTNLRVHPSTVEGIQETMQKTIDAAEARGREALRQSAEEHSQYLRQLQQAMEKQRQGAIDPETMGRWLLEQVHESYQSMNRRMDQTSRDNNAEFLRLAEQCSTMERAVTEQAAYWHPLTLWTTLKDQQVAKLEQKMWS
jgi:hypothetical protein